MVDLHLSFELLPTSLPESLLSLKPHRSSHFEYSTIRSTTFRRKSGLTFRDFHLLCRIGQGDIGTVYLCCLRKDNDDHHQNDTDFYAMKKKSVRAEIERRILKMLSFRCDRFELGFLNNDEQC